jgi:hypothetical protein
MALQVAAKGPYSYQISEKVTRRPAHCRRGTAARPLVFALDTFNGADGNFGVGRSDAPTAGHIAGQ